jgi:Holliday junction DNA helicase RuvA
MFAYLNGKLTCKRPPQVVIDVNGVGYEVLVPMSSYCLLPDLQQNVQLHTTLIVREDSQTLYGFHNVETQQCFNQLIKVNGVGPKMALTILSGMEVPALAQCIAKQDVKRLTRLPGVGTKMAQKLILEMQDKLESEIVLTRTSNSQTDEAFDALQALGYKTADAQKMLAKCDKDLSTEELIKMALQKAV